MKIKPKEILVNLPVVLLFADYHEISLFASTVNTIIHGKVKVKCEELGQLGGQYVGLFYLQRNLESQEMRDEFMKVIENEEMEEHRAPTPPEKKLSLKEIEEIRKSGILINNDGVYCRQVPECGCGECR